MSKFETMPLSELTSTIERLKGELERRKKQETKQAVAEIRAKMEEFDLGIADLGFSSAEIREAANRAQGGGRGAGTKASSSADRRRKVAPKYRDPESGTTWTGRGRMPRWMTAAIAGGRTRDEFLIEE